MSFTYRLEFALISLVNWDGWLPAIGYFRIYRPLSPINVFLFWFMSAMLRVSLWKERPGSTLISAADGSL